MNGDQKSQVLATDKPRQHHSSAELDSEANSECSEILKRESMILDLPPEIISLILIRLPVLKTLSILKCVNTYFSPLISCPYFVREHFKLSSEDASMSSYKVMVEGDEEFLNLKQTLIQSLCHESFVAFDNLAYPEKEPGKVVWLVRGSCNGLVVVIVNQENWFLWNPSIRKYKRLPTIVGYENLEAYVMTQDPRFCGGLGFDANNDDYKVVALFPLECQVSKSKWEYVVNVYSLKRNSWIRIPDFAVEELTEISGEFVSGNLHWCTGNGDIVSSRAPEIRRRVLYSVITRSGWIDNRML